MSTSLPEQPPAPDEIVGLLSEDHNAVKALFGEVVDTEPSGRAELFWKLTEQLVRHEVAEEVTVYPALRDLPEGDLIAEARLAEQSEAEEKLARLEKMDATAPEFLSELVELRGAVLQHATSEEQQVFPLLEAQPSEWRVTRGQRYKAAKLAAPTHPHPNAPNTPPGNLVLGPVAAVFDRIRDAARGVL